MFSKNLTYYRLKMNMTKKALAEACGVSAMAITHYEKGTRRPDMAIIQKMADVLQVNVSDFIASRRSGLTFHHGEFRKNSRLSVNRQEYVREAVEEYFGRMFNVVDCLGMNALPDKPALQKLKYTGSFENDAATLRDALHLPKDGPITELISILENTGIFVLELNLTDTNFSGMNGTVNGYPYIVINKNMNAMRKRSTIVHELAHIMFEDLGEDEESYATAISGAFLIPQADLYRRLGLKRTRITKDFVSICKEYGISTYLLVKRAAQNGIVSEGLAQNFYIKAGKAGWRSSEPDWIDKPEEPSLFRQLVYRAINEGELNLQKGAELLHLPYSVVADNCGLVEVM